MIVSETPNQSNSCWFQAYVLLCAALVLPLGLAYAQDYEAVERRLGEAVSKGELSLEQADVMMDALRRKALDNDNGIGDRLKAAGERLKAAVAKGTMTEEEAWTKWAEIKKRIIKGAVTTGKISRENAGAIWRKIENAEIGERLKAAVSKGEMTEEEAWAKWAKIKKEGNRDAGIEGHYLKLGVNEQRFDRILAALHNSGLTDEQVDQTLGGMLRVIHEMQSAGKQFELNPRLRNYFKNEVGLTDKQIERVQGLARRVAHGTSERGKAHQHWEGIRRPIEDAVEQGEMTREEADVKYREIRARHAKEHSRCNAQ